MFFKSKDNSHNLEAIIAKCKEGDSKAQRELIKMYLGYAKTVVSRYLHIQEEQEEVINDGFLKIFTHIEKHDPSKSFKGWVRTIFVNTAIDYYNKYNKLNHVTDIEDVEITDLQYDVISKLSADEIMLMVQQLSPVYKMVFTLYVIEGYNHREIAEMLNIKEGTSKSNLQDARRKLQMLIGSKYPHLSQTYALKITKSHER